MLVLGFTQTIYRLKFSQNNINLNILQLISLKCVLQHKLLKDVSIESYSFLILGSRENRINSSNTIFYYLSLFFYFSQAIITLDLIGFILTNKDLITSLFIIIFLSLVTKTSLVLEPYKCKYYKDKGLSQISLKQCPR